MTRAEPVRGEQLVCREGRDHWKLHQQSARNDEDIPRLQKLLDTIRSRESATISRGVNSNDTFRLPEFGNPFGFLFLISPNS